MSKTRFLVLLLATFILTTVPVSAQLGLGRGKDAGKEKEKAAANASREARRYERLKQFALGLYEKDLDFQDEVDEHYDNVQREHSQEAFRYNVAQPARYTVVHDGDRLRLQEGLYDNKIVQDYLNRVGQSLVPEGATQLFAFRLLANPVPAAYTMSTGTIYVSTGLVSLLDNEAQLAYVLAHEMAHVYKDHWKLKSMLEVGQNEFNEKQARKRAIFGLAAGLAGAGIAGGISGSASTAMGVGATSGIAAYLASHLFIKGMNLNWDRVQEDEADQIAFDAALKRSYDVQEVPKLYVALQNATRTDRRVGLGFLGSYRRVQERIDTIKVLIGEKYKAELDKRLSEGKLVGSSPEFQMVMSELKRDNGIMALYHDMFGLAKSNLEYAVSVRSNDPAVHYYYGKVLKLVGRTPGERNQADQAFLTAAKLDNRKRFYGAHLYRALHLMSLQDASQNPEIVRELQAYMDNYLTYTSDESIVAEYLPANVDDLYDYLKQAGEVTWTPKLPDNLVPARWVRPAGTGLADGTGSASRSVAATPVPDAPERQAAPQPVKPAIGRPVIPLPARKAK